MNGWSRSVMKNTAGCNTVPSEWLFGRRDLWKLMLPLVLELLLTLLADLKTLILNRFFGQITPVVRGYADVYLTITAFSIPAHYFHVGISHRSRLPACGWTGIQFFLNGMIADMGASSAVAGIGVVRKIDSFAYAVNQGITQGMLPIVSYCYASKRIGRMKSVIWFSSICTVVFSVSCTACSWLFAPQLVRFFIRDADTVLYGSSFLRVMCIAISIYPILFVIIAVFQAAGQSFRPFLLSLLHKGSLDIVLFFLIRKWFGTEYILWASPVMEAFALVVGTIMIKRWLELLKNKIKES